MALVLGDKALSRLIEVPDASFLSLSPAQLDFYRFDLAQYGELIYEYAENARFLTGWGVLNMSDAFHAFHVVSSHNIDIEGKLNPGVERVWRKALARGRLDSIRAGKGLFQNSFPFAEDPLGYEDVAAICDMTPASVRNYTSVNASDRLLVRRGADGRVYMDEDSLLDWIQRRRGYRETTVVNVPAPENAQFATLTELKSFLLARQMNFGPSKEAWAQALGVAESEVPGSYQFNTDGVEDWQIGTVIRVAKALDLADTDFIRRATDVLLEHKLREADLLPKGQLVRFPKSR